MLRGLAICFGTHSARCGNEGKAGTYKRNVSVYMRKFLIYMPTNRKYSPSRMVPAEYGPLHAGSGDLHAKQTHLHAKGRSRVLYRTGIRGTKKARTISVKKASGYHCIIGSFFVAAPFTGRVQHMSVSSSPACRDFCICSRCSLLICD
ncbi:hypothetical protein SAMN04488054_108114 [Salibacterium qingdaonense]|uniref:Uncharacterized protein n=1 Tax=Salibacterium qingdaonense TaxID=266892 RepID=A0A1I4LRU0_9BACI|nr:hypothetical protein SAMN04488054_108114 [Salibacterium qingdaonense]